MKSNGKSVLTILAAWLLMGCTSGEDRQTSFSLEGAWTLAQVEYPSDNSRENYPRNGNTQLRIYEGDSVLYQYYIMQTDAALVVSPFEKSTITLIDKGGGERLYLEDSDPHPLTVVDDTTMTLQISGILYTWHRNDTFANEWGNEIRSMTAKTLEENADEMGYFVFSAKEREQEGVIHGLLFAVIGFVVVLFIIVQKALNFRRERKRLQLRLNQIQEEHTERPQPIRQAIASVESAFFASDAYYTLQRRICSGERLRDEDWNSIETQLKQVYPGFTSQLRTLYSMSELEYQTSLLLKLRIAPKDIAAVLSRDISTISTVRSRLYQKVFGKKGGAKDWDEFILSIGA